MKISVKRFSSFFSTTEIVLLTSLFAGGLVQAAVLATYVLLGIRNEGVSTFQLC